MDTDARSAAAAFFTAGRGGSGEWESFMRTALPGHTFIETKWVDEILALISGQRVDFVASQFPRQKFDPGGYRNIARDAWHYRIPAVFFAHSHEQAFGVLGRAMLNPNVGIAYSLGEVEPLISLLRERVKSTTQMPRASANLDNHPLVAQTTAFLRNRTSGRLDTRKIAALYGEPLSRFAAAYSVTPAAVTQTPDSTKYQSLLGYFERAARIIPLLESKSMFATWAKTPNDALHGGTPVDMLFGGAKKAQALIDVVEDVLTGQPD